MSLTTPHPTPTDALASPRTPSARRYWIGAGLVAAGFGGALMWGLIAFFALVHHVDGYQRMSVPGVAIVQVDQLDTRVLYYEVPQRMQGLLSTPASQLGIRVTDPNGAAVPVRTYWLDLRYDVPGSADRVGRAVAAFDPKVMGDYRISVEGSTWTGATLAVGDEVQWRMLPHLLGAAAVFLIGSGTGVTLIVVTGMRRSRQRPS
jgi:hypothetical protein